VNAAEERGVERERAVNGGCIMLGLNSGLLLGVFCCLILLLHLTLASLTRRTAVKVWMDAAAADSMFLDGY
jgi:hypothetical protein